MRNLFLIIIGLCMLSESKAQSDLAFYGDVMVNASHGDHRERAGIEFKKLLEGELKKSNSFANNFDDLKWISIKHDSLLTFKLFTWQVKSENGKSKSYGFVQTKNGKFTELIDQVDEYNADLEYEQMSASSWYGALYYNIKETTTKEGKAWLLFGYDAYDEQNRVKVIDVLSFDGEKPVFGKELFVVTEGARPDVKQRELLEYYAMANVNSNYNEELGMIMMDHIVPRAGVGVNGGVAKIPDGTYSAYSYKEGQWVFMEKVPHQILSPEEIFFQPKPAEAKEDQKSGVKKKSKN